MHFYLCLNDDLYFVIVIDKYIITVLAFFQTDPVLSRSLSTATYVRKVKFKRISANSNLNPNSHPNLNSNPSPKIQKPFRETLARKNKNLFGKP